ncbi:hypothetical protein Halru_0568 [Halovivax ruber XH-70]|uniref:DUF8159 domain-containing protein n=1 Tax=Halovivax ruber (strain DSM 18193 / JCM 13892 / XH-70) TaxID=797302 RepID=L0IAD4_HALRX|nr:hypothetical protein [Halovivax ruber]AGB15201.1 hypothetical protein Halru_0568 [Halovivax ruber XH-70]
MSVDGSDATAHTRRHLLTGIGGLSAAGIAGCLGDSASETNREEIRPAEPPIAREGTPAEFYYFLEENGITVEKLTRGDDILYLTYQSGADTIPESNDEIGIVYQVYKGGLVDRGSDISFLNCEIAAPFDDQAHGWGVRTEWIHEHDGESDSGDDETNATNETQSSGDRDLQTLWNLILNSKVYGDEGDDGS